MKYKLYPEDNWQGIQTNHVRYANNLEEAAIIAEQMRQEYHTSISCYPRNEDIVYPISDYRIWKKDCFGDTYWVWMKVNPETSSRLYTYLK